MVQLSHLYITTGKTIALTIWTFASQVRSLLFIMLSRLAIAFIPRSKCFFNFLDPVTICSDFGAQENKICHCFHFFPFYCPWVMGPDAMILIVFWKLSFKPDFSLSSFTLIKRHFSSSSLSAIRVVSSEVVDISPGNLDFSLWFIQPSISHDVFCIEVK